MSRCNINLSGRQFPVINKNHGCHLFQVQLAMRESRLRTDPSAVQGQRYPLDRPRNVAVRYTTVLYRRFGLERHLIHPRLLHTVTSNADYCNDLGSSWINSSNRGLYSKRLVIKQQRVVPDLLSNIFIPTPDDGITQLLVGRR